jgi:hypothetical protein
MPYLTVRCCVCRKIYGHKPSLVTGISDGYCADCAKRLKAEWFGKTADDLLSNIDLKGVKHGS